MATVLRFSAVTYVRDGRTILDHLDWAVNSDERWVVLGPNGAGKTSALRIAAAHEYPSSGSVEVLGEQLGAVDVGELRNRVGFASSAHARMIPAGESVRDVVMTAAYGVAGRWNEQYDSLDVRQAERILAEWDLSTLSDRTFATLSDGERKRTLIARAVMTDPEMLLLDEPSANLDLGSRERLIQTLSGFAQSPSSPAMVMVTHHVEEIPAGFTHVLLLRDGLVTATGPLEEALTAETLEETFGLAFDLNRNNGRYSAVARV
jgi:iron complex transport system ATP-binding protein